MAFLWLGLGITLAGIVLLTSSGLFGLGSTLNTWVFRLGLLLMLFGLGLSTLLS